MEQNKTFFPHTVQMSYYHTQVLEIFFSFNLSDYETHTSLKTRYEIEYKLAETRHDENSI